MSYCHAGECSDLWDQVWSHDQKEEEQEHSEIDSSENEYEGTALSPPYDYANKDEEINMGTQNVTCDQHAIFARGLRHPRYGPCHTQTSSWPTTCGIACYPQLWMHTHAPRHVIHIASLYGLINKNILKFWGSLDLTWYICQLSNDACIRIRIT